MPFLMTFGGQGGRNRLDTVPRPLAFKKPGHNRGHPDHKERRTAAKQPPAIGNPAQLICLAEIAALRIGLGDRGVEKPTV